MHTFRLIRFTVLAALVAISILFEPPVRAQVGSPIWLVDDVAAIDLGRDNCQAVPMVTGYGFGADGVPMVGWTQVEGCSGSNRTYWGERPEAGWQVRQWNYAGFWSSPNGSGHAFGVGADGRPYMFMVGGNGQNLTYGTFLVDLREYETSGPAALVYTGEFLANHQECVYVRYQLDAGSGQAWPYRATFRGRCDGVGPLRFEGQQLGEAAVLGFDLAMGADGRAHLAYIEAGGRVMYVRPGGALVHVATVNRFSDDVAIAAGADGTLHLLARGFNSTADYDRGRVGYLRSTDDGATWTLVDYPDESRVTYGLSLQLDASGAPAVALWRYGQGLFYLSRASGQWAAQRVAGLGFSGEHWVKPPVLRMDALGVPHIAYYDWAANRVRVAAPAMPGVTPPVDLQVAGQASPSPTPAGTPISFAVSVANTAPREATGVRVRVTLPAGASATGITPAPISHTGGVLVFDSWRVRGGGTGRDALGSQAVGTISFDLNGVPEGIADLRMEVSSAEPEAAPADNDVTLQVQVYAATCAAPVAGREGWWPADGSTTNYGSVRFHGTAAGGVTYGAGAVGQAFQLDGTTGHIDIHNNDFYFPGNRPLSVAAWFTTARADAAAQIIASHNDMGGTVCCGFPQGQAAWFVYVSEGRLRASLRPTSGGATVVLSGTRPIADGGWHHAALVVDVAAREVRLYLDGAVEATSALAAGWSMDNGDFEVEPIVIGAQQLSWSDAFGNYFQGAIDDVSLYMRVLTATEIADAASGPSRAECAPPASLADVSVSFEQVEQDETGLPQAVFLVSNAGPADATHVRVAGDLPGLEVVFDRLPAGATERLVRRIDPPSAEQRDVTVTVVASTDERESTYDNNGGAFVVTVPRWEVDLAVMLAPAAWTYPLGDALPFTVTVTNHGAVRSPGATLTLDLDGEGTTPEGCVGGPAVGGRLTATCAIGPLEAGLSWSRVVTSTNGLRGVRHSHAGVDSSAFALWVVDPVPANDTMTVETIAVANDPPKVVAPIGPIVMLEDANVLRVSAVAAFEDPDGDPLTFTAASSAPAVVDVAVQAATGDLLLTPAPDVSGEATITLTASDGEELTTTTFVVTVRPVNDAPAMAAIPDQKVNSGSELVVTLTGVSPGPADEKTQTMTVTAVSSHPAVTGPITVSGTTLRLTPPARTEAASVIVTITVTDDGGTADGGVAQTSRAFGLVVEPAAPEPTTSDLVIVSATAPAAVYADQAVTYTVVVRNDGPAAATGVVLWPGRASVNGDVQQPAWFVGSNTCQVITREVYGTTMSLRVECRVAPLAPGQSVTLTFGRRPQPNEDVVEMPMVLTGDQEDPDTANNTRSLRTVVMPSVDLAVSLSAPRWLEPSRRAEVVAEIRNLATKVAENVQLVLALDQLALEATPAGCAWSSTGLVCPLGRVGAGETRRVSLRVGPMIDLGMAGVRATVSTTTRDTDPANNTAEAPIEVKRGSLRTDIGVTGTYVGGAAVLTVTNHGPADLVTATAELHLTSSRTAGGSDVGSWTVSPVCPFDENATRAARLMDQHSPVPTPQRWIYRCVFTALRAGSAVTVVATPSVSRPGRATVTLTVSETGVTLGGVSVREVNLGNNRTTVDFQARRVADLSIVSASAPTAVSAGGQIWYTVTVRNDGPATATGVSVGPVDARYFSGPSSEAPRPTEWVVGGGCGWVTSGGGFGPLVHTYECQVDRLEPGQTATVRFARIAPSGGRLVNTTVTVTGQVEDPAPANNDRTLTTQILRVVR